MRGLFGSLAGPRPKAELRDLSMEQYARLLGGGVRSAAGIEVSTETAINFTTVAICLRVLGESVASLPCFLYRRKKDGSRERATDHPTYRVTHDQSNAWLTAFEYFEGSMVNLSTRGNAYSFIDRNGRGQVIGLTPLNPDGVEIKQATDWSPIYTATLPDNTRRQLSASQIHHVRGPLPKGYMGRSMIAIARDTIGLGIAAERFGSNLFMNGARPSGTLEHPKNLSEDAQKRLIAQVEERHTGEGNWLRPMLLEEGMKWVSNMIAPDDAQFLETRKYQRTEIAGLFRVPAHFINDLEKATFSNIEHQSLDFVIHSLRPWLKRWEQAMNRDLLIPAERGEYFFEFLIDDLLRGDFKTRMEGLAIQIQNGMRSPDEARSLENLAPRPDGKGGEFWRPANMYPPKDPAAQMTPAKAEAQPGPSHTVTTPVNVSVGMPEAPQPSPIVVNVARESRSKVVKITKDDDGNVSAVVTEAPDEE